MELTFIKNVAMTQIEAIEISRNYVLLLRSEGISVDKAFYMEAT